MEVDSPLREHSATSRTTPRRPREFESDRGSDRTKRSRKEHLPLALPPGEHTVPIATTSDVGLAPAAQQAHQLQLEIAALQKEVRPHAATTAASKPPPAATSHHQPRFADRPPPPGQRNDLAREKAETIKVRNELNAAREAVEAEVGIRDPIILPASIRRSARIACRLICPPTAEWVSLKPKDVLAA